MAQRMSGSRGVESLWNISSAAVKKNIPISVDLLCGLPRPLVEELAVCLHWSDLLKLEEYFNCKTVTEKAWRQAYEEREMHKRDEWRSRRRCSPTCDCHSKARLPLTYRDRWFSWFVSATIPLDMTIFERSKSRDLSQHKDDSSQLWSKGLLKIMREVKELSIDLVTMKKLPNHPELIAPLTTSLVVLKVDFGNQVSFHSSGTWLKVLKELMQNGRLRILHLLNMGIFTVDWLVLFFIVSGLFHCSRCARHFPVLLDMACRVQCPPLRTGVCHGATNTESRFTGSRATRATVRGLGLGYGQSARNHCKKLRLTLHLVNMLRDLGYTGLTGVAETEHSASASHHAHTRCSALTGKTDYPKTGVSCSAFQGITHNSFKNKAVTLMKTLSDLHKMEGHEGRGVEHLSASWTADMTFERGTSVHVHAGLCSFLSGWSSLSSVDLDFSLCNEGPWILFDYSLLFDALLERIKEGTLLSVALNCSVNTFCFRIVGTFLCRVLKFLIGLDRTSHDGKTIQPLKLLKIDSYSSKAFPILLPQSSGDISADQPEKADGTERDNTVCRTGFPGVQELDLKVVVFNGVRELSPVAYLIRNCDVLSRISLQDCSLTQDCVDLLLQALDSRVVADTIVTAAAEHSASPAPCRLPSSPQPRAAEEWNCPTGTDEKAKNGKVPSKRC
ncbi:uncharacterized protein LOC143279870 isoform X2 [Babylonia areolata]|uniref:uncharacterized protein LOC143279870 isoform X2 n=1 Tax=Babylonia areolata TaxID=304850 RepID=UPI003FCF1325